MKKIIVILRLQLPQTDRPFSIRIDGQPRFDGVW